MANPAQARLGGGTDTRWFASVLESTLLVTLAGSILDRAPSPPCGACRLNDAVGRMHNGPSILTCQDRFVANGRSDAPVSSQQLAGNAIFWRLSELSDVR